MGPLPFTQAPGGPLIGKVNNVFRTNSAAAWPPEMCLKVSNAIMDELDITAIRRQGGEVRVLYLFSGKRREGSVRDCLENGGR